MRFGWFGRNWVPVVLQVGFLLAILCLPRQTYVYSNFTFYFCLFVYCAVVVGFSPHTWWYSLRQQDTWKGVGFTSLAVIFVVGVTLGVGSLIPDSLIGMIMLPARSPLELGLFAFSTMLLAPIAEELFYRKSLILQGSNKAFIATSVFSCVLYALNHALMPMGVLLISCWAIPFVIAYVKTKNIYVPMTAHILLNLIVNGATLITALG